MTSTEAAAVPAAGPTEDQMYERVVDAILDRRLPPGTKLVEGRLASAFGVSRTRIRPVLVRLANERVVNLSLNRGASVAQPNEREAREVFEVRRMIEPTLIECFIAQASGEDVEALARNIADEEASHAAGDARRAIRLAGDFHLLIAQGAQHQTLGRILRELVSRTSLVLMTYGPPSPHPRHEAPTCGCQEHRSLLAAIRGRNTRKAARLMREHLEQLESQLHFNPPADATPDLLQVFQPAADPG